MLTHQQLKAQAQLQQLLHKETAAVDESRVTPSACCMRIRSQPLLALSQHPLRCQLVPANMYLLRFETPLGVRHSTQQTSKESNQWGIACRCHWGACPPCSQFCGTPHPCGHACASPSCHDRPPPAIPAFAQPMPPACATFTATKPVQHDSGDADSLSPAYQVSA